MIDSATLYEAVYPAPCQANSRSANFAFKSEAGSLKLATRTVFTSQTLADYKQGLLFFFFPPDPIVNHLPFLMLKSPFPVTNVIKLLMICTS